MSSTVPFLTREYIESEAEGLLAAYGEKHGHLAKPPIPADEILNAFLHVTLDFDDLPKVLGVGTAWTRIRLRGAESQLPFLVNPGHSDW